MHHLVIIVRRTRTTEEPSQFERRLLNINSSKIKWRRLARHVACSVPVTSRRVQVAHVHTVSGLADLTQIKPLT